MSPLVLNPVLVFGGFALFMLVWSVVGDRTWRRQPGERRALPPAD
jgi:uncharacterized membrane protein